MTIAAARKSLPLCLNRLWSNLTSGTPSHSCPFWQPSCTSRRSAPDGPKRLGTAPTHKAVGRDFFVVCKTAADCHLRPANCVYFMNLLRRSRIRRGRPKPFWFFRCRMVTRTDGSGGRPATRWGLPEASLSVWVCRGEAASDSEATGDRRPALTYFPWGA